jgi:hypothetical protein
MGTFDYMFRVQPGGRPDMYDDYIARKGLANEQEQKERTERRITRHFERAL